MARLDGKQISAIFDLHGPAVYRRAFRLLGNHADAEEATQEVFLRVVRGLDGFEAKSHVTTWLYRITTNYCLNQLRNAQTRAGLDTPAAETSLEPNGEALLAVRQLLSRADEKQAEAAAYVFIDGMSHAEVADVLGVSRRTVGNLIERFQQWATAQLTEDASRKLG